MRQRGAKHSRNGTIHRYYYACQACEFTGVWGEEDGGTKSWEHLGVNQIPLANRRFNVEISNKGCVDSVDFLAKVCATLQHTVASFVRQRTRSRQRVRIQGPRRTSNNGVLYLRYTISIDPFQEEKTHLR